MTPTIAQAILIAVAVLAILFLIHRFAPNSAVGKAEGVAMADAKKAVAVVKADLPDVEADIVAAGQRFILWATDKSAELAKIAEATAAMAKKDALASQTVAALSARQAAAKASAPTSAA